MTTPLPAVRRLLDRTRARLPRSRWARGAVLAGLVVAVAGVATGTAIGLSGSTSVPTNDGWQAATKCVATAAVTNAAGSTVVLDTKASMTTGTRVKSPNGTFELVLEPDGNLVLYDNQTRAHVWESHTTTGTTLLMQSDGNLVLYDSAGKAPWATGSNSPTANKFLLRNDGTLQVVDPTGKALWSSATVVAGAAGCLDPTATFFTGTTAGASVQLNEPAASGAVAGQGAGTVWFSWYAAQSGTTYVLPQGETFQSVGAYVDDTSDGSWSFPLKAVSGLQRGSTIFGLRFTAVAGTHYYFQVYDKRPLDESIAHEFEFQLWQPSPGGPDNDDLATARSLDEPINSAAGAQASLTGTTVNATTESDESSIGSGARSLWYSWTSPDDGVTLKVVAPTSAGALTAYVVKDASKAITVTNLTQLSDLSSASGQLWVKTTAGQTVYVRLGTDTGATFTLGASDDPWSDPGAPRPTVVPSCAQPSTSWATEAVTLHCTVTDDAADLVGLTLDDKGEYGFDLTADVPDGTASATAATTSRTVCDTLGNCTTVGPLGPVKIDHSPPVITCDPAPGGWSAGAVTLGCAVKDDGSGVTAADAAFTLAAALPSGTSQSDAVAYTGPAKVCDQAGNCTSVDIPADAKIDQVPPTVDCGKVPTGWSNANPTISCTATDTGSGLADQAKAELTLTTGVDSGAYDASATTVADTVCDAVGNCADVPSYTLKVDRVPPTVSCDTPAPGSWTKGRSLTYDCTAHDLGSGLAAATDVSFTVTTGDLISAGSQSDGVSVATSRSVCDVAGNCADVPSLIGVGLDDQVPEVTCNAVPTTWQRSAATVTCTAVDDGGSGLASAADASFTLTSSAAGVFAAHDPVCDAVGNCATVPTPAAVEVDETAPVVTCDTSSGDSFDHEVLVSCTATDDDSGLADPDTASFTLLTAVGDGNADDAAVTETRQVCDVAGNCTTAGPVGPFRIDRTGTVSEAAPVVEVPDSLTVVAAADTSETGGIEVPFDLPTADSEIGAQVGCSPDPDGILLVGETEVQCSARDTADQVTDASFPVTVVADVDLAYTDSIPIGSEIPIAAEDFAGDVTVEFDGTEVGDLSAASAGLGVRHSARASVSVASSRAGFAAPNGTTLGRHLVVIRGTGTDGNPRLQVAPVTIVAAPLTKASSTGPGSTDSSSTASSTTSSSTSKGSKTRHSKVGGSAGGTTSFRLFGSGWSTEAAAEPSPSASASTGTTTFQGTAPPSRPAASSGGALRWWLLGLGGLGLLAGAGVAGVLLRRRRHPLAE
ncbi:MAG: hypothetical protein QM572_09750 [Nocardioides sp.]|uniref:hypothetical protein n=1 Tax=Nocardioides sp. TaxID=35761 RepID=UPI0039E4D861